MYVGALAAPLKLTNFCNRNELFMAFLQISYFEKSILKKSANSHENSDDSELFLVQSWIFFCKINGLQPATLL